MVRIRVSNNPSVEKSNGSGKAVQPKPDELAALAEQVLSLAGSGKLTDAEARARLQTELAKRSFSSLRAYAGSLEEDPAQAGQYYLAVDADANAVQPLLLQLTSGPRPPPAGLRIRCGRRVCTFPAAGKRV